jgi:hypothetical protein
LNFIFLWLPWWVSHFKTFPWNPQIVLTGLDSIIIGFIMLPWGVLVVGLWSTLESAWLDVLDPDGKEALRHRD